MPANKKQHYVPQFYLRQFSTNGKNINIWNIGKRKKIIHAKLKSQCYKNYFYSEDTTFETSLSQIEQKASRLFKSIIQQHTLPEYGSQEQLELVLYLLMLHGRTLHAAASVNEMMDDLLKHILKRSPSLSALPSEIDWNDIKIGMKNAAQFSLGLATSCYPVLLDLNYVLLLNETRHEFITSDNPVVLYNQLMFFRKSAGNSGLSSKGLQIFFPLCPNVMLCLYDSSVYSVNRKNRHSVIIRKTSDVLMLNSLQICSALNNIYFMCENLSIEEEYDRSCHLRAERKTDFKTYETTDGQSDGTSELLMTSRRNIEARVNLKDIALKFSAKRWKANFIKSNPQPVVIVRNPYWHNKYEHFRQLVDEGEYKPSEFLLYLDQH